MNTTTTLQALKDKIEEARVMALALEEAGWDMDSVLDSLDGAMEFAAKQGLTVPLPPLK